MICEQPDFYIFHSVLAAAVFNGKIPKLTAARQGKGLFPREELFLGNLEGGTSQPGELQVFAGTLDMDNQGNIIEEGGEKYGDTSLRLNVKRKRFLLLLPELHPLCRP